MIEYDKYQQQEEKSVEELFEEEEEEEAKNDEYDSEGYNRSIVTSQNEDC